MDIPTEPSTMGWQAQFFPSDAESTATEPLTPIDTLFEGAASIEDVTGMDPVTYVSTQSMIVWNVSNYFTGPVSNSLEFTLLEWPVDDLLPVQSSDSTSELLPDDTYVPGVDPGFDSGEPESVSVDDMDNGTVDTPFEHDWFSVSLIEDQTTQLTVLEGDLKDLSNSLGDESGTDPASTMDPVTYVSTQSMIVWNVSPPYLSVSLLPGVVPSAEGDDLGTGVEDIGSVAEESGWFFTTMGADLPAEAHTGPPILISCFDQGYSSIARSISEEPVLSTEEPPSEVPSVQSMATTTAVRSETIEPELAADPITGFPTSAAPVTATTPISASAQRSGAVVYSISTPPSGHPEALRPFNSGLPPAVLTGLGNMQRPASTRENPLERSEAPSEALSQGGKSGGTQAGEPTTLVPPPMFGSPWRETNDANWGSTSLVPQLVPELILDLIMI